MNRRLDNEIKTVRIMIGLFCRARHGQDLCDPCGELLKYVEGRVGKCPHGHRKPACSKCEVHCFKPEMRARIREVMKFSGPRMVCRHPVLAFRHWRNR